MGKKILIVDDEPDIVDFLQELLQDNGYETCVAYNGNQGLDVLKAEKPDLVTLDMEMPEKGGTMFFVGLKKSESAGIPVIVISGVGPRPPTLSKGVPTISKPIQKDELLKMIGDALA